MINPIELFDELDKTDSEIEKLRDAQREFLGLFYSDCIEVPRIGLKLPTGAGKSLIAILILEAYRRAGKRVAILCANKGLADDMKEKFDEFKLPTVTIFGGSRLGPRALAKRAKNIITYTRADSIGIFNYHSFMYGYGSSFSFQLPDVLIIDDASDFEIVRNIYGSIRIERYNPDHKNCYDAILSKLSENQFLYSNVTDFQSNDADHRAVELVLFPHHKEIIDIIDMYKSQLNEDSEFLYSYRRNKDLIDSSLILVSQYDIEIRPFVLHEERTPLNEIPQIIFMSATLPKKDLLHKIFGIDDSEIYMLDESKLKEATFNAIQTMGCRLIFPLSQEYAYKSLSMHSLEGIKELYNIHNKILIMVNSFKESRQLTNYFEAQSVPFILYRQSDDGYDFAHNTDEGCLICVNRFFGLDFPGETCKIGIIAKLPLIWDSMDRFQISVLDNNDYKEERLGNRITQALGRCNRLENDESIYYIFDSSILNKIVDPNFHGYYPKNIFSELMAGFVIAEGDFLISIKYGRDSFFGVDKTDYLEELQTYERMYSPVINIESEYNYMKEITAWKLATRGSYRESAELFNELGGEIQKTMKDSSQLLGLNCAFYYYLSSLNYYNSYVHYGDSECKDRYKDTLKQSIEMGKSSSWFNKLSYVYNIEEEILEKKISINEDRIRALGIKEQISYEIEKYVESRTNKNRNWDDTYLEELDKLNDGSHGQMLQSLEVFFGLLGYKTKRGDNQMGEPDLIIMSMQTLPKYQLGVEVKSTDKVGQEGVKALGEVLVDIAKIEKDRPEYVTIPAVITQKTEFSEKAKRASYNRTRLITTQTLSTLFRKNFEKIKRFNELASHDKVAYRESLYSPIELFSILSPEGDGVLKNSDLDVL